MPVFVYSQGIKNVHAGGRGGQKWQNSVQVVVECPLIPAIYIFHFLCQFRFFETHLNETSLFLQIQ